MPLPSSSMNFSSFSDFFTASQLRILHTRISHLANSSMVTLGSTGGAVGALWFSFSRASSSLAISSRGNRVSPLQTFTSAGSTPYSPALSQLWQLSPAPICRKAFSQLSGMKGVSRIRDTRSASSRLYITEASRAFLLSSLASTQGAVSSMYLLARWISLKISSRARCSWKASICFSYLARAERIISTSSSSMGSASRPVGRLPPKYFSTMAVVRDTRLPRSLARSVLMVLISSSLEKLPSEPKGKVRSRKKRRASTPKRSTST